MRALGVIDFAIEMASNQFFVRFLIHGFGAGRRGGRCHWRNRSSLVVGRLSEGH